MIYIGIDPGVNTGFAIWGSIGKKFIVIESVPIHYALRRMNLQSNSNCMVIVEDARQVRFKTDIHKAQGAGSVKRDCKIWEDFLTEYKIPFKMVRPVKALTKISADAFAKMTGYKKRTNQHGRDAAMLVYGR